MLQFIGIHHQFGPTVLFEGFSWHIKPGQKVGLVGPNGSGKTTLFQFAAAKLHPDKGTIVRPKKTEISLFQQIPNFDPNALILDTVIGSNTQYKEYSAKKQIIDQNLEQLDHTAPEYENYLHQQSDLEDFAHAYNLHNIETRAKVILTGLGFTAEGFYRKVSNFSPGFHHRLGLAIALLNPHNLLLLDEPTNHLDDASKNWLMDYLISTKAAFVLVTHDPEFLNATVETIAEISMKGVTEFQGTLEEFLEEKNELHEKLKVQYQKEEAFLKKRTEWINRFRAQATKAKQVQSVVKRLEKRDKVENPEAIFWNKKPDYQFRYFPSGKLIAKVEDASFSYSGHGIFQKANMEISLGDKVALVGPNGAGKSTLLKCILGSLSFTKGSLDYGPKTRIGYFSQSHQDELELHLNLMQSIQKKFPDATDQEIRSLLGFFSFSGDAVYKTVSTMSGGEQSRLRLAMLVLEPSNCLLLDEPTNHLDLVTRNALKAAIHSFEGSSLIISHDPDFLKDLCNKTYLMADGELKNLNCSFSEYIELYSETSNPLKKETKPKSVDTRSSQNIDKKRLKKMEKEIAGMEETIGVLEQQKSDIETTLSDPNFYKNANHKATLDQYSQTKKDLSELMEKWEQANIEYETLLDELSL